MQQIRSIIHRAKKPPAFIGAKRLRLNGTQIALLTEKPVESTTTLKVVCSVCHRPFPVSEDEVEKIREAKRAGIQPRCKKHPVSTAIPAQAKALT